MALARVVSFEGVDADHMREMTSNIEGSEPPDNLPATEMLLLHDESNGKALAIVFFDNEEDYAQGDATLNAMNTDDTPGNRTGVEKYDVAMRMTV